MKNYETTVLTTPYAQPDPFGALAQPVYHSAAFEFPSAAAMSDAFCGRSPRHSYSRISNPTVQNFERRVARYTGAMSVTALNTGMAAISGSMLNLVQKGCNVVTSRHLFGNTFSLLSRTLGQFGVEMRTADLCNLKETERLIDENTCALFFEIITNPQMEVADIAALAQMAHSHGVPVMADTTIVPFTAFHAREFGVDIELISSTKYISAGATGLGGLILDYGSFDWSQSPNSLLQQQSRRAGKKAAFTARLKTEILTNLGIMMTPYEAYMQTLGLETLDIRFRRQASSALWLAQQLTHEPRICRVNHTALEGNPYHELSERQFGPLPGAMLTVDLATRDECFAFIDALKVIRRATNLFDHRSLAIHPASTIFGLFTPEERGEMDVLDTTVRLSIGLEDPADLLDDIRQALESLSPAL